MKRSITRWTTTLATAALLGMPGAGMAQTPTPQQPPTQQPPAQQPPTEQPPTQQPPTQAPPAAQPPQQQPPTQQPPVSPSPSQSPTMAQGGTQMTVSPEEHLRQAKAALDSIPAAAVTGRGRTQLAELKRHMTALERLSAASGAAAATRAPGATSARGGASANWGTEVAAIDKILTELTAGESATATGMMTGTTGTAGNTSTGTAGSRSKAAAAVTLDDATRAKLMEVRTHVVGYAAGKSAPQSAPKGTEASAGDAPAAAAPATQGTAGTLEPRTNATGTATTQENLQTAAPSASTAATAAPQVEQDVARQHLTAARDTLAELTKLPAAAQLTGDARTQVSQVIANFNELITTQSNWTASYSKVEANLNALLGADTTDAAAAAPAQSPTPDPSATPGAVGTSGTAKAELDPAVRAKLVDLRRNLSDFQKAAGAAK